MKDIINTPQRVLTTSSGSWLHAPSSDFIFAYEPANMSASDKKALGKAFSDALPMSSKIKAAVKKTSSQDVVNGLYLLDQKAMTKAMNSIDGMGMTAAAKKHMAGDEKAEGITQDFFNSVLGALGGDVAPMLKYLQTQLGDVQAQKKKETTETTFGIVVGLISLMPGLGIPVTSFQYVFLDKSQSTEFEKILCFSSTSYTYKVDYTVANYNYILPT